MAFTFSLSGIFLGLLFIAVVFTIKTIRKHHHLKLSLFRITTLAILVWIVLLFKPWQLPVFTKTVDHHSVRLLTTLNRIEEQRFIGSEGSRGNALYISLFYLKENGLAGSAIGEGYANADYWLSTRFAGFQHSAFARGAMPNMITALILAVGIPGLIWYLLFLAAILKNPLRYYSGPLIMIILAVLFLYGNLISYLLWSLIYFGGLLPGNGFQPEPDLEQKNDHG